jgi:hypothetical protein
MMGKVLSITEKRPVDVVLPDGVYLGIWGGHVIELTLKGKTYELGTDVGVKGIGYKVAVTVKNGEATYQEIDN